MDETQESSITVTEQAPAARLRTLSNGAVYDMDRKRIVTIDPSKNPHAITKENTQYMHERKRAQTQAQILHGIAEGTGEVNWARGVRKMAAAVATIASDPSRGRATVYAFEKILQQGGLGYEKHGEAPAAGGITVHIGAQVAEMLAEMVFERANG